MTKEYYKGHVLGRLRERGPCTLNELTYELRTQAQGPWDQATSNEDKRILAKWEVVACLNELCREGKAELYDTGDAWDARYE